MEHNKRQGLWGIAGWEMEGYGEELQCQGPMLPGGVQGAGGSSPGQLCPGDWGSKGLGTGLLPAGLPPSHFDSASSSQ